MGTYRYVRHPLYLGCVLTMFGGPLLVGSVGGLILASVGLLLIAGRIL